MTEPRGVDEKLAAADQGPEPVPWLEELPPRQIVAELDRYIVGQDAAKRAVAIAVRNRWRLIRTGTLISFTRELKPFRTYTLRLSMTCWDRNWIYMRFVFEHRGKLMAAGYVKGSTLGSAGINSRETFGVLGLAPESPPFPPSLQAWIDADRKVVREA